MRVLASSQALGLTDWSYDLSWVTMEDVSVPDRADLRFRADLVCC